MRDVRTHTRLEILPGLTVDEICSVEQADEVFDQVVAAVAAIEGQLGRAYEGSVEDCRDWRARARHALRIKKVAMPQIQARRAALVRQQKAVQHAVRMTEARQESVSRSKLLLKIVSEIAPTVIDKAIELGRIRHPEVFDETAESEVA